MTWTEIKFSTKQVKKMVEDVLLQRFPAIDKEDGKLFRSDTCGNFYVCAMGEKEPWNFLVISYKDSDGDAFYPSDYDSFESLVEDMIEEIEDYEPDD